MPAFNFYAKLSAVHAQEPLSGQTVLLDNYGSEEVAKAVTEHSRAAYATKVEPEEEKPKAEKSEPKPTKKSKKIKSEPKGKKRQSTKILGD